MWKIDDEIEFFQNAISSNLANLSDLFYDTKNGFLAYIPKNDKNSYPTLQARNSLIGNFSEIWCQNLLSDVANKFGLFAIKGVICDEIGLIASSRADLAFCTKDGILQDAKDIKIIFEIKMSVVNNYKFQNGEIAFFGDYKSHKAQPSLTRSDSVLKAIGKAINIRISSSQAAKIPIVILGNTHISDNYMSKIDHLGRSGVLQKVLNLSHLAEIKNSPLKFFQTSANLDEISSILENILSDEKCYFSAMLSKTKLGEIIKNSALLKDEVKVAENFLNEIKKANL